jgi:hypothetical protein
MSWRGLLVAAGLPDNPQPPIGAEIIDVADFRAVLPIHHGLAYRKFGHEPSLSAPFQK